MRQAKLAVGWIYLIITGLGVALYLAIRHFGLDLIAPLRGIPFLKPAEGTHASGLGTVMVALAIIVLLSRLLGVLCERWLRQPPVIGEILAGIMLGPSLLGMLAPHVSLLLFPLDIRPSLNIIAQVGVVLFMFVVGLEIDAPALRKSSRATVVVSHASIVFPFVLGGLLALLLYPMYGASDVSFTAFSLFLGISMSITAFPVLARILRDQKIQGTPLGLTVLACAAIDDVTAWTLLALVVGIVSGGMDKALTTLPLLAVYFGVMFVLVRPLFQRLCRWAEDRGEPSSTGILSIVIVGLLLSAAATEWIGIHALFGAFLFGAFLPNRSKLTLILRERIEDLVTILFLPVFFAFTGLRTQMALVSTTTDWMVVGLVIMVAIAGKFGGSFVAARYSGLGWRESSAIGVLMNARGLVELIVLNIGLDLGVLSPKLFSMLVLMALVTTLMTSPIFSVIRRGLNLEASLGDTVSPAPSSRNAAVKLAEP